MRVRRKRRAPDAVADQPLELAGPGFSAEGHLEPSSASDWSQRADERMMSGQLGAAINKAVEELPEDYRTVFLLKDLDRLSNVAIAQPLDPPLPPAKPPLPPPRLPPP